VSNYKIVCPGTVTKRQARPAFLKEIRRMSESGTLVISPAFTSTDLAFSTGRMMAASPSITVIRGASPRSSKNRWSFSVSIRNSLILRIIGCCSFDCLQPVIVDFGAEVPFNLVAQKLQEHYGTG